MRAKKSLGQNFLQNDTVIRRIIDAVDLNGNETVVEIGPGHGALTEHLVQKALRVIAIEFDREITVSLRSRFASVDNFHLINDDALRVDLVAMLEDFGVDEKAKLVANLPYNISTPILQRLINQRHLFTCLVLMFQREVVERITAKPGGKKRGYLSVLVENAFETEYLFDVNPQAFAPKPKVWSAVVRLTPKPASGFDETLLRQILSVSFSQKRKNILNNLKTNFSNAEVRLEQARIEGKRRAETLALEEWIRLTELLANKNDRTIDWSGQNR
jgi:16S rRNA (adenine1518-N6/adenine1519-N6)-dimethyltransferase